MAPILERLPDGKLPRHGSDYANPSGLTGMAWVGAEGPAVSLRVLDREVAGAVVGVVQLVGDLRAMCHGPLFLVAHGAQHDAAAGRPGQLGVIDLVPLAVDDDRLEAEGVDEELDEPAGVAGAEGGPDVGRGRLLGAFVFCHAPIIPSRRPARLGRFGALRRGTG